MAKFLTAKQAYAEIEEITRKADRELVLISPYIKIPDDLLERLKYLKNVKIILVCREDELKKEERNKLSNIDHLELRSLENLHAKCFYNQESMVITSLNLHEHSEQNNLEMGILLTQTEDRGIFLEARKEANYIVNSATPVKAVKMNRVKSSDTDVSNKHRRPKSVEKKPAKQETSFFEQLKEDIGWSEKKGYCIRGGDRIPFDASHPFCSKHYMVWKKHKNTEYPERYCHDCGEEHQTSFSNPICRSCLKKNET